MNNLQQTARVGLFFLLGLALTWVTFETLSGGKILKREGYLIVAGFDSLKELKEGDEVRMAGVRIGDVKAARLAGRRAEAILRISPEVAIKDDAIAMIASAGLIGTNYVTIDLGTATAADLVPSERAHSSHTWLERLLPFLQKDPVPLAEIKTKSAPDLNSIMTQIGSLGEKLEGALGGLGKAFAGDDKNPGLLQKIDTLVT
ncbi:MAG: MlaD family protein, partial [Opitutaceae bacterium]